MTNCGITYDHPRHFLDVTGDGMLEPCDTSVRERIIIDELSDD